jgi:S-adenosylmethionine hydrolase
VDRVIVLLTDFGYSDPYVGVMKGVIKSINPYAEIIDLSHGVRRHNVYGAAIMLMVSARYFPRGTIFVCVVDPGVGSERKALLVETSNYYLIGPDNGCLSLLMKRDGVRQVYDVSNTRFKLRNTSHTFHGRDLFAPVAAYLSLGYRPEILGVRTDPRNIKWFEYPQPVVREDAVVARALYIDVFGNIMTNIEDELIRSVGWSPGDYIEVSSNTKSVRCRFVESFSRVREGEYACYINSWGFFEIAINRGDASKDLGIDVSDEILLKHAG